ncbi:PA14 domain protein OS=Coleofasciculus chthonoplastes PCC 7420 GN=MC7420_2811 PE=4 SV=1 [Gemmataceae bacterium]|nr:PA14 domain protein OS=Coleofasciculus chthonoplastes PCC 7420 GN=MC7420_2811 PE=4 SV=1 [Gemmataceae bacterium]VTU01800.1 PA14 domain protein OS=Coleofasciculus chthonoplastes PCC 7420 GN=MC7420_2811 PE=4 SV=1 [Gemmataceae bacterium]
MLTVTGVAFNAATKRWEVRFTNDNVAFDPRDPAKNTKLRFDHRAPLARVGGAAAAYDPLGAPPVVGGKTLDVYVANLTRNVVFRSLAPGDGTLEGNQGRGHVMVMHAPNAVITNAQFKDLGRSDKRYLVNDADGLDANGNPVLIDHDLNRDLADLNADLVPDDWVESGLN